MYEIVEHTADIGLRIRAATLEELFADAGRGLLALIVSNPEAVRAENEYPFHIAGSQPDYLLLDWLSELLFALASRQLLLCQFVVRFDSAGLNAIARGEPIDRSRHELEHEVKAVTYHGLKVFQTPTDWRAEVILDI